MFRIKERENDSNAVAGAAVSGTMAQPQRLAVGATTVSCIWSDMSIVGIVECSGPAQVFGRVEGELRATDLIIGEGAQIEGSVVAQEVTVSGRVKGSIRAVHVRLQGGTVEGDIFNRSLSIDENSVFEGMSRRIENLTERRPENATESSNAAAEAVQTKNVQSPPLVPSASPTRDGVLHEH
jgi:cytoskeletal protein CcmA (bactofilin family)